MKTKSASSDPWLYLQPFSWLFAISLCSRSNHIGSLKIYWIGHILSGLLIFTCSPSYSSLYVANLYLSFSFQFKSHFLWESISIAPSFSPNTQMLCSPYFWCISISFSYDHSFPLSYLQCLAQCLARMGNYCPLEEQKNE